MSARGPVCMSASRPAKPPARLPESAGTALHVWPSADLTGHLSGARPEHMATCLEFYLAQLPRPSSCLLACLHACLSAGSRLGGHALTWRPISARFKANLSRSAGRPFWHSRRDLHRPCPPPFPGNPHPVSRGRRSARSGLSGSQMRLTAPNPQCLKALDQGSRASPEA